ncbi:MAG: hypothetical protein RLZZ399_636 [Verrucomicrobiota bacterium]|jgi:mono/diheme cytochrome c family protein
MSAHTISLRAAGVAVLCLWSAPIHAQEIPAAEGARFFREKVHPILQSHCVKCHGGEKIKGGLVLTNRAALLKGGENGSALEGDTPGKSLLLDMMSYRDGDHEMPPAGKRPEAELEILRKWVALGAPYDPELEKKPVGVAHEAAPDSGKGAAWWAYQPLGTPAVPRVQRPEWNRNPVDAFLWDSMQKAGLQPNPRASRVQLVRRAYYDLIGLPPTPEEVKRFVEDSAPDAWPRLIDSLLAKPQYGEKWARHWMDIIRYAETEGFERDNDKPHIWRYRDYLIEAFNADLPYSQFVTEQLAGDELEKPTQRSLTATGFLRLMQWDDEPADRLLAKYDVLADNVQVIGEAFLGMTLGCARCHDHKKDPITQRDYYSFMAFFHGMKQYPTPPTLWVAEEERQRLGAEKRERLARMDAEYERVAAPLLGWYAKRGHQADADSQVLVEARAGVENAWIHTAKDPGPHWRAENFNAAHWESTPVTGAKAGQSLWMRARFGLAELPKEWALELEYRGETEVFVNGSPLFQGSYLPSGRRFMEMTGRFQKLLHTGSNLIAVRVPVSADGALPQIRVLRGKSPLAQMQTLLPAGKDGHWEAFTKEFGGGFLVKLRESRERWFTEAERPIGIALSAAADAGANPAPLAVHKRGNPQSLGDPVEPAFPAVLAGSPKPAPAEVKPIGTRSSGRRIALARWLTQPENSLARRVMVNRLWQHHFGKGIVPTPNDFGRLGELPTHPELLDFLARTFLEKGESLKAMHRLLMNSEAYQMSSAANPAGLAKDPENRLLWRFPMRRLTAEELRDSILSVSGTLILDTYGPPVHPPIPAEVLQTQSRPGSGWPKQTSAETARRSVYVKVKRSLSLPLLNNYDQAPTDSPCAVRFASTVPTQALGMLNSEFMEEQSQLLAARLRREAGDAPRDQIRRGMQLVLQREPSAQEIRLCLETFAKLHRELHLGPEDALRRMALMLLNLNEFLYVD